MGSVVVRLIALTDLDLWFRVRHREFDPMRLYRAIALAEYQESASASLVFVTHKGYLWFVKQTLCISSSDHLHSAQMDEGRLPPWPTEKPKSDLHNSPE